MLKQSVFVIFNVEFVCVCMLGVFAFVAAVAVSYVHATSYVCIAYVLLLPCFFGWSADTTTRESVGCHGSQPVRVTSVLRPLFALGAFHGFNTKFGFVYIRFIIFNREG